MIFITIWFAGIILLLLVCNKFPEKVNTGRIVLSLNKNVKKKVPTQEEIRKYKRSNLITIIILILIYIIIMITYFISIINGN